jgi:hypothetical protein
MSRGQMTAKDALSVHARAELGIDPEAVTNPWAAAFASFVAFTIGGLVPILAMLLSPQSTEIWVAGIAVVVAMALTGVISARLGHFCRRSVGCAQCCRRAAGDGDHVWRRQDRRDAGLKRRTPVEGDGVPEEERDRTYS